MDFSKDLLRTIIARLLCGMAGHSCFGVEYYDGLLEDAKLESALVLNEEKI